eukprot:768014-Hanusia_phi.AAC.2
MCGVSSAQDPIRSGAYLSFRVVEVRSGSESKQDNKTGDGPCVTRRDLGDIRSRAKRTQADRVGELQEDVPIRSSSASTRSMTRLLEPKQENPAGKLEATRVVGRRQPGVAHSQGVKTEENAAGVRLFSRPLLRQANGLRGRDLIGARVRKHFRRYGVFGGRVVKVDRWYTILYEDGDVEDFTLSEVLLHLVDAGCSLGMDLLEEGSSGVQADLKAERRAYSPLSQGKLAPFLWSIVKSDISCRKSAGERRRGGQELLEAVERHLSSLLPYLDKSELLMSTWALAAMGFEAEEPLLTRMEERVSWFLGELTEDERIILMWSLRQVAKGGRSRQEDEDEEVVEDVDRRQNPMLRKCR